MKKLLFLSVGVFLSLFLAGCGDDEKSNSNPQDIGEIRTFLERCLTEEKGNVFFTQCKQQDTCFIVNNKKQFHSLYAGNEKLPEIDFKNYTLLLGKSFHTAGLTPICQEPEIEVSQSNAIVKLVFEDDGMTKILSMEDYYYWKIIPKCDLKHVEVNTVVNRCY